MDWNDERYEDMTWTELSSVGTSNGVPRTRLRAFISNKMYGILWLQETALSSQTTYRVSTWQLQSKPY